jgi:hypothetical protein
MSDGGASRNGRHRTTPDALDALAAGALAALKRARVRAEDLAIMHNSSIIQGEDGAVVEVTADELRAARARVANGAAQTHHYAPLRRHLPPDLAQAFPDDASVEAALRTHLAAQK